MKKNLLCLLSLLMATLASWGHTSWTDSESKLKYEIADGSAIVASGTEVTDSVVILPDTIKPDGGGGAYPVVPTCHYREI